MSLKRIKLYKPYKYALKTILGYSKLLILYATMDIMQKSCLLPRIADSGNNRIDISYLNYLSWYVLTNINDALKAFKMIMCEGP